MTLILNLISRTGWMGSIDLHINRQNPSISLKNTNKNLQNEKILIVVFKIENFERLQFLKF